jgi:ribonuclease Z
MWRTRLTTVGAIVLAVLLAASGLLYLNRETLIAHAIKNRLQSAGENDFPNDPNGIRVLLCGTGAPELIAAAQACTMVSAGGRMFVFDVGEGATRSLANSGVPIADIEQVFITHYHSDHFNGLGTLINQGWNWGRTEPLRVAGPVGTVDVVGALASAYALDNEYRTDNMSEAVQDPTAAQAAPTASSSRQAPSRCGCTTATA